MMTTRAQMVNTAAGRLAQAATIAIRYSCVRQQGFESNKPGISYLSNEKKILDHKIQQYRLLKQLAAAYACKFTARWMIEQLQAMEGDKIGVIQNTNVLKELFATSAGLKSLTTIMAINGAEECRKCCGGNGYLLNSGIGALTQDYLWQITAEGDFIILGLNTAKTLLKNIQAAFKGEKITGVCSYFNVCNDSNFNLIQHRPQSAKISTDFLNLDYLLSLFRYYSLEKNVTVARDYMARMKNGASADDAFNFYSDDFLKAQNAHAYYILMNNFVSKVHEMQDKQIQTMLTKLCIIFACTNFLDNNWGHIFEREEFNFINQTTSEVLKEVRPDAIALVDSFDYPDQILRSSIGRYDGNVYESLFDAAQKSIVNRTDPFDGYEEHLSKHLNKDLLRHGNKSITTFGKL